MKEDDTATTSTERDEMSGSGGDDLSTSGERHVLCDPNDEGTPVGFRAQRQTPLRTCFFPTKTLCSPSPTASASFCPY